MIVAPNAELVRSCFNAYMTRDRNALENLLADDFRFTSPYDDAIDKAAYFVRCWPNNQIQSQVLERVFAEGDGAFVTYRCVTHDGKHFRNTEFFTFSGDKIKSIDVYFGATFQNGNLLAQN